jgi:hypothetical protein
VYQDHLDAKAMILAPETMQAGIIYLENEAMELELPGGRVWKVFGSPVSKRCFVFVWLIDSTL